MPRRFGRCRCAETLANPIAVHDVVLDEELVLCRVSAAVWSRYSNVENGRMQFETIVDRRRMVRRYTAEPVASASIDRMLRNAVRAPNAGFAQGWAFLRLDEPEDVALFWESTTPTREGGVDGESSWLRGMRTAPVVIVPLSSKAAYVRRYSEGDKGWGSQEEPRWSVPYWHVDAGMAALLVLQTAVDEGLGGCFFGIPAERLGAFRTAFEIPDEYEPVGAITIGHAEPAGARSGSPSRRPRRPLDEVVHRGRWGSAG